MYIITDYTYAIAKAYGVLVIPSNKKDKKIQVTLPGGRVLHLGDIHKDDYATLLVKCRQGFYKIEDDNKRQENFRKRFQKQMEVKDSGAYWVAKLLWLL